MESDTSTITDFRIISVVPKKTVFIEELKQYSCNSKNHVEYMSFVPTTKFTDRHFAVNSLSHWISLSRLELMIDVITCLSYPGFSTPSGATIELACVDSPGGRTDDSRSTLLSCPICLESRPWKLEQR
jgi:hypothetical protein